MEMFTTVVFILIEMHRHKTILNKIDGNIHFLSDNEAMALICDRDPQDKKQREQIYRLKEKHGIYFKKHWDDV